MKRILLIITLNFITLALCAQIFSGKVANKSGEGIPYAALYFKELMQGITTDENGLFSIHLSAGTYTCEVTSLGYMPMQVSVDMTAGSIHRDMILQERVYTLREVNINSKAEDPAYAVMRKAIAFAPRNLHRVQSYEADMYLKGSGRLDAIPSILKISKEIREISKKYTGKVFLLEEQREITYHSPNTWEGKVLAYSNTFPEEVRVEIGISTINFYQPQLMGKISPLSPGAFSYYRYRLEDCYVEGEQLINKIKVIPRNDNPHLLSGDLYIVDGCWCIAAASLQLEMTGAKMDIQVTCKEIKPDVYLPVSVSIESQFSLMGLKASAGYLAAIQYHDVVLSSSNVGNTQSTPIEVVQKPAKQEAKLEKLLSKEDITIREAYYLNKLMEQASRPDSLSSTRKYERISTRRQSRLTTDSLATTKDSLYWLAVRSVPLKPEEQASYDFKRELTLNKDSSTVQKSTKNQRVSNVLNTAINGHTFESKDKKSWLAMHDLFSYVPEYNQVDGWWVGAKVSMGYRFSQATSLSFTPSVYYAAARRGLISTGDLTLQYAPRRLGKLQIEGGVTTADYNGTCGESRFINGVASSLFGRNDLKLYEKRFATISNQIELANSLLFTTSLSWQRRQMLENHVQHSWFKKQVEPNYPSVENFTPMPANELLLMSLGLQYTPGHYYTMRSGRKVYDAPRYPTIAVEYDRAFALHNVSSSSAYQRVAASIWQNIDFGMFNQFNWSINGGLFWDKSDMQFPDYQHFCTPGLPVTEYTFDNSFALLSNYAYSTNSHWVQAHVSWYTPYLLFKQIPFLKRMIFDEALHLRMLKVGSYRPYSEVGYSIGVTDVARVGVFVGFESWQYKQVGVSVSIPLIRNFKQFVR